MEDVILVRYGEISLKGKNRAYFEKVLVRNIKSALAKFRGVRVIRSYGRIFIEHEDSSEEIIRRLQRVFGIVSVSSARVVPLDIEEIRTASLEHVMSLGGDKSTFKVNARRPNKNFPYMSPEVNEMVGAHVLENTSGFSVDLHNPDIRLTIEIREENAYIYSEGFPAPGGLPVGVTGKGGLLISGGIDSPVAGWLAMKRGIKPVGIHFYSFPFTSERSKEKVVDLCRELAGYGGDFDLNIVHFTEIQKAIRKYCPEKMYVTVMRRMMFRIAERICCREGCPVLVTGENIGQVASQTLESMSVIENVVETPVLRPLVTMDKTEIISKAEEIGTYDISIQPYEDCCTLFVPKHPVTKPRLDEVEEAEAFLPNFEELLNDALEKTEVVNIY